MSSPPRVSVLIATHNRPALLRAAIQSVIEQTYPDWEIVVVDDASDPPADLAEFRATLGERLSVVRHDTPRRSGAARNTAMRASRGGILAFLDDDDLYDPQYLEKAVMVMDRFPEVQVVCMGVEWFGKDAEAIRPGQFEATEKALAEAQGKSVAPDVLLFDERLLRALVKRVPMAFQQQVVRREAVDTLGEFTEGRVLDRSDWALRAALETRCALYTRGLYLQRCDGQSYASRPDRYYEFLLAGVDVMDRLVERASSDPGNRAKTRILREGAAKSWFDLAYHHAQQGARRRAIYALVQSLRRKFVVRRLRLAARVALDAITLKASRNS